MALLASFSDLGTRLWPSSRTWERGYGLVLTCVVNCFVRSAPTRFVASPANHCRRNQKERALSALPYMQFVTSCLGEGREGGREGGRGREEGGREDLEAARGVYR